MRQRNWCGGSFSFYHGITKHITTGYVQHIDESERYNRGIALNEGPTFGPATKCEKKRHIIYYFKNESISRVTVDDVSEFVEEEFGLLLDNASIVDSLDFFEDEGYLSHKNQDLYEISKRPEIETFDTYIQPLCDEFDDHLRVVNPDIDIQFINKNMQPAFRDFLYEFFSTIHQSSEEAPDFEVQTIESIDCSEIIENIVREHNLNQAKSFREALRNYLEDPTDLLLDFTDKVYTGIINYHLISKEREIDFESLPSSDNRLFLDTNILVALLMV